MNEQVANKTDNQIKNEWIEYIEDLQNRICQGLELADGKAKFKEDKWIREEGGGGKARSGKGCRRKGSSADGRRREACGGRGGGRETCR